VVFENVKEEHERLRTIGRKRLRICASKAAKRRKIRAANEFEALSTRQANFNKVPKRNFGAKFRPKKKS
jgi:hypothetical protein